jgi:hypothetical protein
VKKWLLLLLIPVLAAAGVQVWNEAFAQPPDTVLPGIVVDLGGASPTPVAWRPLPAVPTPGYSGVNR